MGQARRLIISDETEADGACTEATRSAAHGFATHQLSHTVSDSVAVVTLLVNWSLKKLLLGTR